MATEYEEPTKEWLELSDEEPAGYEVVEPEDDEPEGVQGFKYLEDPVVALAKGLGCNCSDFPEGTLKSMKSRILSAERSGVNSVSPMKEEGKIGKVIRYDDGDPVPANLTELDYIPGAIGPGGTFLTRSADHGLWDGQAMDAAGVMTMMRSPAACYCLGSAGEDEIDVKCYSAPVWNTPDGKPNPNREEYERVRGMYLLNRAALAGWKRKIELKYKIDELYRGFAKKLTDEEFDYGYDLLSNFGSLRRHIDTVLDNAMQTCGRQLQRRGSKVAEYSLAAGEPPRRPKGTTREEWVEQKKEYERLRDKWAKGLATPHDRDVLDAFKGVPEEERERQLQEVYKPTKAGELPTEWSREYEYNELEKKIATRGGSPAERRRLAELWHEINEEQYEY